MNGRTRSLARVALGVTLVAALGSPAAAVTPTPPPPTPTPIPTPTPTPTPRYELGITSGKASKVAAVPTPGPGESGDSIVKITGSFAHAGPAYLLSRKVTLQRLLDEQGGAGELVEELQGPSTITLNRSRGNDDSAIFTTAPGSRPSARLSLRRKPGGVYLVNLSLNRANIPNDPLLCAGSPATTTLAAEFLIADAVQPATNPAITVAGTATWTCFLDDDKLRIMTAGDDDGGNQAPRASVRTELLDRDTGLPSRVELDGSNSSDADGTIASYAFSVETKPAGVPVFTLPAGAASTVTTPPLPPGDYTAVLIVTDNLGAKSTPGTRGFSIK